MTQGKKTGRKYLSSFLLIIVILFGCMVYWIWEELRPTEGHDRIKINIPSGSSSRSVAVELQNHGLIRNAIVFELLMSYLHQTNSLQAGTYQLQQGMTPREILSQLVNGKIVSNTIRFTIPEGYTIEQIAKRLNDEGIISESVFLQEADHGVFHSALLPSNTHRGSVKHPLEGYLFPSTYEIYKGSSAHEIIQLMLSDMGKEITPDIVAGWKANGLTVNEGLTLASMIEREAKVDQERPEIAEVILNRLHAKPPMRLQIDATIEYIVGQKPLLTDADLQKDSPYNTYLNLGLPPGPIANPGLSSIKASAFPASNHYFYYVTKKDGSGTHYFAKTYQEQLQNEEKSLQNEKQAGGNQAS